MPSLLFRGRIVLPDRVAEGMLLVRNGRVAELLDARAAPPPDSVVVDAGDGYVSPGFIDLHVHGGDGGDFMDGTAESFRLALQSNARHGTTRLAATTTVATHEQILATLQQTRHFRHNPEPRGSRVLGAHFYGPYFRY